MRSTTLFLPFACLAVILISAKKIKVYKLPGTSTGPDKTLLKWVKIPSRPLTDISICLRYFHDSLPYGTGPGTDTDLASVMNGEGNRRFDEYISFVTIGKDPKDPSLIGSWRDLAGRPLGTLYATTRGKAYYGGGQMERLPFRWYHVCLVVS